MRLLRECRLDGEFYEQHLVVHWPIESGGNKEGDVTVLAHLAECNGIADLS